jgi:peptidoglycan/LPS O-acetylase OafA/YrhL
MPAQAAQSIIDVKIAQLDAVRGSPSEAHTVFEARSSPWWAYPLFLQNFLVPIPTMATGLLGVSWSLAVEEQFYLVWASGGALLQ